MKTIKQLKLAAAVAAGLALVGCGSDDDDSSIAKVFNCEADSTSGARVICIGSESDLSDATVQQNIVDALLTSETGDTIVFPQGRYNLTKTISFQGKNGDSEDVDNVTFRGAGMDKTIFDGSNAPQDTFKIEDTDGLIFEDFGIYESNNNALKVVNGNGIIMRRMATVWETDYQPTNGAYGLYPVESSNILVEDNFVKGSADAGVYVGQSSDIVVRNNIAEKNVAGIEIENSTNADVYDNVARGNTGGILVFDLPIGNGKYGSDVRIFDNVVENNNAPNFAAGCTEEQKANDTCFEGGVHIVPPGTGVIILSTSNVEIYNNTITDHQTAAVAITSYMMPDDRVAQAPNQDIGGYGFDANPYIPGDDTDTQTQDTTADDVHDFSDISKFADKYLDGWSPFVNGINIHDNTITVADGVNAPEGDLILELIVGVGLLQADLGIISGQEATKLPAILYDGVGELLTKTPQGESGVSVMEAIARGTTDLASAVHGMIGAQLMPMPKGYNDTTNPFPVAAPAISDYTPFGFTSYATDATSVCQSNNTLNGGAVTAAAIFPTTPGADTFTAEGIPLSKVEMAGIEAAKGTPEGLQAAATIGASILSDDSMTCSGTAYEGTSYSATIRGVTYGCNHDDHESNASCSI